jgi:hypothetical protein
LQNGEADEDDDVPVPAEDAEEAAEDNDGCRPVNDSFAVAYAYPLLPFSILQIVV